MRIDYKPDAQVLMLRCCRFFTAKRLYPIALGRGVAAHPG